MLKCLIMYVNLNLSRCARLFVFTFWNANIQFQNSKLVIDSNHLLKYLSFHREWLLHWTDIACWPLLHSALPGSRMIREGSLWTFTFPAKNSWSKATFCLVFRIVFSFSFSLMKSLSRDHFAAARGACRCRLSTMAGQFSFSSPVKKSYQPCDWLYDIFSLVKNFVSGIWLVDNATRTNFIKMFDDK